MSEESVEGRKSFAAMLGDSLGGDDVQFGWDEDSGETVILYPEKTVKTDAADEDSESGESENGDDSTGEDADDSSVGQPEVEEEDEAGDEGQQGEASGDNWEKRFKDTQAALTKKSQELSETKGQISELTGALKQLAGRLDRMENGTGVTRPDSKSSGRRVTEQDVEDAFLAGDSQRAMKLMKELEGGQETQNGGSAPTEVSPEVRALIIEKEVREEFQETAGRYPDFLAYGEGIKEVMAKAEKSGQYLTFEDAYWRAKGGGYKPDERLLPESQRAEAAPKKTSGKKSKKVTKENAETIRKKASKLQTESGVSGSTRASGRPKTIKESFEATLEQFGYS